MAFSSSALVSSSVLALCSLCSRCDPEFAQPGWRLSPRCSCQPIPTGAAQGRQQGPQRDSSATGRLKTRESPPLPVAHTREELYCCSPSSWECIAHTCATEPPKYFLILWFSKDFFYFFLTANTRSLLRICTAFESWEHCYGQLMLFCLVAHWMKPVCHLPKHLS